MPEDDITTLVRRKYGVKPISIFVAETLLAGLFAACLVPLINSWLEKKRYRRQWKRDVLARLVGYRYLLVPPWVTRNSSEPYIALNQVVVAFDDSPPVITALNKFHEDRNNNNLVTLIRLMAKSSGVRLDGLKDDFLTRPLNPPLSAEEMNQ